MASSTSWFLVIEALVVHIKKINPALLIDLLQKIPDISDDFTKKTRELVCLRVLENLYEHAIQNKDNHMPSTSSSSSTSVQIDLDPSESCVDVIDRIFQGEPTANLNMGGPEILKWDIRSFVMHKRSHLTTSSLQKLKDGILEGRNPILAALKDRIGLEHNTKTVEPNQESNMNQDEISQENLPVKRNSSNIMANDCVETESTCEEEPFKKRKVDFICTETIVHLPDEQIQEQEKEAHIEENTSKDDEIAKDCVQQSNETETMCEEVPKEPMVHEYVPDESHIQEQGVEPDINVDDDEISSDSDEDDDKRVDIESNKKDFMDSLSTEDSETQIIVCMKCKKSGDLLVCSTNTCLVSVHESCIEITPEFDENGKFVCPFCVCSVAMSVYKEAKKEVLLAREKASLAKEKVTSAQKNLTAFIGSESHGLNQEKTRVEKEVGKNSEKGQKGKEKEQVDADIEQGNEKSEENSENGSEKDGTTFKYRTRLRDQENPNCEASPEKRKKKAEEETSKYLLRRKKLAWSKLEEDTLRVGMEKFASGLDGRIPWTKILEYGGSVFQGRNTIDLKDKWRNLSKKEYQGL